VNVEPESSPAYPGKSSCCSGATAPPETGVQAETRIWLGQILAHELQTTREVVVRRLFGEPAQAISLELGLENAATRQRISRFKRRHSADLLDAA